MTAGDQAIVQFSGAALVVDSVSIPGVAWSVSKAPTMQTRIQRSVSGRELRALDYPAPLWQFQLTFNLLRDQWDTRGSEGLGSGFDELRTLFALYLACYGAYGTFLFSDPTDNQRTGQYLGTGNSSTTQFQLQASYGSSGAPLFTAPVTAVGLVSALYLNGVTQNPSTYSYAAGLGSTGIITFAVPPVTEATITADFSFYFRCRFVDDSYSFENFMYQLWQLKKLSFISVFS
jgi:uncharacterized protein (TIGR02217 family)